MLWADEFLESLLDIDVTDHSLVRPDPLFVPGGSLPQSHPNRSPVVDNNLIYGTAGTHHCAMGYCAAHYRVEIAVHAPARNADSAVYCESYVTA